MENITGAPVTGENLFGREYELGELWKKLGQGEHLLMLAPRRIGKTSLMQELSRAPKAGWDVFYVDLEAGDSPEDCFAAILAALAGNAKYRSWLEAVPFQKSIADLIKNLDATVAAGPLTVDLKGALGGDWQTSADRLTSRLASPPLPEHKLLIILDELPVLIIRMLARNDQSKEIDLLLGKLREMRQAESLKRKVIFLVGGSIGLSGVLRRLGSSALINDFSQFQVTPWDRDTAERFLFQLADDGGFALSAENIARILDHLGELVPYHVQLFFDSLRQVCRGDPKRLTEETIAKCFNDRLAGPSGSPYLDHYFERLEMVFGERELRIASEILGKACRSAGGVERAAMAELENAEQDFMPVLRELEADGYLGFDADKLWFKSHLLRLWWARYHARGGEG